MVICEWIEGCVANFSSKVLRIGNMAGSTYFIVVLLTFHETAKPLNPLKCWQDHGSVMRRVTEVGNDLVIFPRPILH